MLDRARERRERNALILIDEEIPGRELHLTELQNGWDGRRRVDIDFHRDAAHLPIGEL